MLLAVFELAAGVALAFALSRSFRNTQQDLSSIPAIGPSHWLTSWFSALKAILYMQDYIQEGYEKYKGRAFRIPEMTRWVVVLSGDLVHEYLMQTDYTMGKTAVSNPYHIALYQRLTRKLADIFPLMHEEAKRALDDALLVDTRDDWQSIDVNQLAKEVVCSSGNMAFVGPQLARDPRYVAVCCKYSDTVAMASVLPNFFPDLLKPLVLRFFAVGSYVNEMARLLGPIIEERRQNAKEDGQNEDDLLQWLMEKSDDDPYERTTEALSRRILLTNFVTVPATLTFTHAMYHVAANAEYAKILREEVASVVSVHGWSKDAMDRLYLMDSLFKETTRFDGLGALTLTRKARETFQLSDGTVIPRDTYVTVAKASIQHDKAYFRDPDTFDPWRFAKAAESRESGLREKEDELVYTSATDLGFGHGRTACPGRFFAAMQMKMMMAHLVYHYEITFAPGGAPGSTRRPGNKWFAGHCIPDPGAKLYFRRLADKAL
uniref:Cytochrome P450 n=1 Tax=Schizophyllum commune (strain H4-8 / FGSC 9210) TaxID=578458 RepID=D8Q876_SCHCM